MKLWRGEKVYDATVVKVKTPEGTAMLIINETNGIPLSLELMIGKAGSGVRAWSYAMGKALSLALNKGATIEDIISELSNTHSDRVSYDNGIAIRSGVDGLVKALMKYQSHKFIKLTDHLNDVPSWGGM